MAMYTPAGSDCTAPTAVPMLNSASEPRNRAGLRAPVSTMVFPSIEESTCAVSTMVSVPCVTSTCLAACAAIAARRSSRSAASMCRLSLRSSAMTENRKATPSSSRIRPICGSPTWKSDLSSK